MKSTLFEIGKKAMFPHFLKNLSNGIDMELAWVFDMHKDIMKINNDKNVKLLDRNLINLTLKADCCIRKFKNNYLVIEMAILGLKSCLLFIALFYPYWMVSICEIKLSKLFGLT